MQRVVAGLGLGLGLRRRYPDDFEERFQAELLGRFDGLEIVGFQHQFHVELADRVIQLAQRVGQDRQDFRLLVHRHQHGIDRQVVIAQRGHFVFGDLDVDAVARAEPHQQQLQAEGRQKAQRHQHIDGDQRDDGECRDRRHQHRGNRPQGELLPAGDHLACGIGRRVCGQQVQRIVGELLVGVALQAPDDVELGRADKAHLRTVMLARPGEQRRVRVGHGQHQHTVLAPPRQDQPLRIHIQVGGGEQLGVRRLLHQVDELQPEVRGHDGVEPLRRHAALGQDHIAQARIPALLQGKRGAQLLVGDDAGRHQRTPQQAAFAADIRRPSQRVHFAGDRHCRPCPRTATRRPRMARRQHRYCGPSRAAGSPPATGYRRGRYTAWTAAAW